MDAVWAATFGHFSPAVLGARYEDPNSSVQEFFTAALTSWACVALLGAALSAALSRTFWELDWARKIEWTTYMLSSAHTAFTLVVAVRTVTVGEDWAMADICTSRLAWRDACLSMSIA